MKKKQNEAPALMKEAAWVSKVSNPTPHEIVRRRGWNESIIGEFQQALEISGQVEPIYTFEGQILANYELAQACMLTLGGFWAVEWKPLFENDNPSAFVLTLGRNKPNDTALKRCWDGFVLLPDIEKRTLARQGSRTDLMSLDELSTEIVEGRQNEAMRQAATLARSNHDYIRQMRNALNTALELVSAETPDTRLFDWAKDACNKQVWSLKDFLRYYSEKEYEILGRRGDDSAEEMKTYTSNKAAEEVLSEETPLMPPLVEQETTLPPSQEDHESETKKTQPPVNAFELKKGSEVLLRLPMLNGKAVEPHDVVPFDDRHAEIEVLVNVLRTLIEAPKSTEGTIAIPSTGKKGKAALRYRYSPEKFAEDSFGCFEHLGRMIASASNRAWKEAYSSCAIAQECSTNGDIQ